MSAFQIHVKRGDHLKGARMLIRVANNISKFPSRKTGVYARIKPSEIKTTRGLKTSMVLIFIM